MIKNKENNYILKSWFDKLLYWIGAIWLIIFVISSIMGVFSVALLASEQEIENEIVPSNPELLDYIKEKNRTMLENKCELMCSENEFAYFFDIDYSEDLDELVCTCYGETQDDVLSVQQID